MAIPGSFSLAVLALSAFLTIPVRAAESEEEPSPDDFVEVVHLDPTIVIDLPYATENNFCKAILYPVERCFLRREVAERVAAAHRRLAADGLGLKIWDGYRPRSVQYKMWEASPLPGYVGDPKFGSKHNRGAAVDVTLVNLTTGEELEMPTPYDEFSPRAHSGYLKLTPEVAANRSRLQKAMREEGFMTIHSEWWHFDYRGWERFPLADIPLDALAARSDKEKPSLSAGPRVATDWPRFRGNNGDGISTDTTVPLEWSETTNVKWKLDLPGPGSSSPIVSCGRIYVTAYSGYGEKPGESEDPAATGDPMTLVRHLLCVDLRTGKHLWTASEPATATEDAYREFLPEHGYASSSPATDGERIYCFYGKSGVFAYDLEGKKIWSAPTGGLSSAMAWGSAASVVLTDEAVIVNAGDEARALLAFDKRSGEELWRMEHAMLEQTYNTPVLQVLESGRTDLIVAFREEIRGLDPESGTVRWFSKSPVAGNLSGSPLAFSEHRIAVFGGFPRTLGTVFRGGGEGDRSGEALLWESTGAKSYMPVPVEHEGHLYWVSEDGIASCAKPDTGEVVYRERLDVASKSGKGMAFYASPLLVNGHLVAVSRHAGTFVIAAKPVFELLRVNRLESDPSRFQGTPAVSAGHLVLRSEKTLYGIAR
jgi:outer membrane protein assembly factor BamB